MRNMNVFIKSVDEYTAYHKGGFRERYAMAHGKKSTVYINGHKCYKYTYSNETEYQDANGATYDTLDKKWIN